MYDYDLSYNHFPNTLVFIIIFNDIKIEEKRDLAQLLYYNVYYQDSNIVSNLPQNKSRLDVIDNTVPGNHDPLKELLQNASYE